MSLKDRADDLKNSKALWDLLPKRSMFMGPVDDDLSDEDTDVSGTTMAWNANDPFAALFDEQVENARKKMEAEAKSGNYGPFTWLEPVCDCGGDKLKTTHYEWCSKMKKRW